MVPRSRWRWARPAVQAVFLLGFAALVLSVARGWPLPVPGDLLLRFDPLIWLVGSVAARQAAPYALFALTLLLATALVGRVFCGWVCPLGTAIDAAGPLGRRRAVRPWPGLKLWVLAALIAAAAAGANFAGWFDPLVIASRALYLTFAPAASGPAVLWAWAAVAAAVALAALAPRFWCRALCPLGAMLSLVARWGPYRRHIGPSCAECGKCEPVCPMGQTPGRHSAGECLGCRRCEAACPRQSIVFRFHAVSANTASARAAEPGTRRRWLVALAGVALGGVGGGWAWLKRSSDVLRPPGTPSEQHLLARCTGCGACLAVCPTGALTPQLSFARPDAAFVPQFVPRQGPCQPECTACGAACSTGALARLTADEKATVHIGLAEIDRSRCLPWARGERCTICVDACPAAYDALALRSTEAGAFRPVVDESRCTGCGFCEHRCPLAAAAIRVVSRMVPFTTPRPRLRNAGGVQAYP